MLKLSYSLWKPLQGAGNDWPLALCDSRTTNRRSGAIAADVVFHNRFTENQLVYSHPAHQWYYFKDLGIDEVIMFRQTDTDLEGGGGEPTSPVLLFKILPKLFADLNLG